MLDPQEHITSRYSSRSHLDLTLPLSTAKYPRSVFAPRPLSNLRRYMATSSSIPVQPLGVALVAALVVALMVKETQAQCPSNDLTPCLPAAVEDVQPSEECCTNLAEYTNSTTPEVCLCEAALSSTFMDDDNVNPLYAILIPQKCNLQFPAGTTCSGFVIPGGQ